MGKQYRFLIIMLVNIVCDYWDEPEPHIDHDSGLSAGNNGM